jgi:di/tricarboxylate transporter
MKNILSILVAVVGVVCVVFGVLFIMSAGDNKATVVDELKSSGLTTATLNATYDQVKGALEQYTAANKAAAVGSAAAASSAEAMQSYGYQKASLGLAKSNLNTIDFVQKSGILTIVIGAALVWVGWGLMKKS